jgi:chromosome segregation ATPase
MSTKQDLETQVSSLQIQLTDLRRELREQTCSKEHYKRESTRVWNMYLEDTKILDKKIQETRADAQKLIEVLVTEATNFVRDMAEKHTQDLALKTERARTDTVADCFAHVTSLLATQGSSRTVDFGSTCLGSNPSP